MKALLDIPGAREGRADRRGISLVETLLVSFLAIVMLIAVYRMLTKSMELADSSSRAIALQQGARNLLENLVRDVNAAHMWADAQENTFTVLKYKYDDPKLVDAENISKGHVTFPFYKDGAVTVIRLPVFKCSYKWDDKKGTVLRKITQGVLISRTPASGTPGENLLKVGEFAYVEDRPVQGEPREGRVVASNVKTFELSYFGYDDDADGKLKDWRQVTARNDEKAKIARVAMMLVRFRAEFDQGLYKDQLRSPDIEIVTKIWSYKRMNDHVYLEYFSSQDEDTRF